MRISQLKTLVWISSVVVFGGVVYAGMQFYEGFQLRRQPVEPAEWPEEVSDLDPSEFSSGVGRIAEYEKIWKTWADGEIPPPPKPPDDRPTQKKDPERDFRNKFKYLGGIVYVDGDGDGLARAGSRAHVSFGGEQKIIALGSMLGGKWQLREYRYDRERRVDVLVFHRNDSEFQGSVTIEEVPRKSDFEQLFEVPAPGSSKDIVEPVSENSIGRTAYRLSDGVFFVPSDEVHWYERWGEEKLLPTLGLRPNELPDGTVSGVKVQKVPGTGIAAIQGDRGVRQGDVIKSINDVPVRSSGDILAYLKGDGAGLPEYRVVIETAGKERTEVYRIERSRR